MMDFPEWTCKVCGTGYHTANCPKCTAKKKREEARKRAAKRKTFQVWIAQVNQVLVEVRAMNAEEAKAKAARRWRLHEAKPLILECKEDE